MILFSFYSLSSKKNVEDIIENVDTSDNKKEAKSNEVDINNHAYLAYLFFSMFQ